MSILFHELTISAIEPEGRDGVAVTFDVPAGLQDGFSFVAGQHLNVRATLGGEDVRRSYSIAESPATGSLTVGVKQVPNGLFSTYFNREASVGDTVEVMSPVGEFALGSKAPSGGVFGFFAAGSGITPILSMVSEALAGDPSARCVVFFGNKTSADVMFLESLETLKDRYLHRLIVVHIFSREDSALPLFAGRITKQKAQDLCDAFLPAGDAAGWYLCGPGEMVRNVSEFLVDAGAAVEDIHSELFFQGDVPFVEEVMPDTGLVELTLTLDGRTSIVMADPQGSSILDRALTARPELPFACKGGVCATCKSLVTSGEVTMKRNYALTESEVEQGYILSCQSHPITDVSVSFDVHGGLGR